MNKIKYEHFDLISVEVIGKKNVKIKYFDLELPNRAQTNDDKNLPSPKLIDSLQELAPIMAQGLGLTKGWDFARDIFADKQDLENLKVAKAGYDELSDNIEVTRLAFLGEKRLSIELKGSVQTDFGKKSQTTPSISLEADKYDISETASNLAEEVKKRVFAYLFQGEFVKAEAKKKKNEETNDPAQTSILDGESQE